MTKKTFYKFITILIQGAVSFLSIIIYVVGTYYDKDNPQNNEVDNTIIYVLEMLEIFIACVITIEYIIKLVKTKNKCQFLFKYLNILDVIAVIPTFLSPILQNIKGLGFTRVFRMVRLIRIFKIYKSVTDSRKDRFEEEKNVIFMRLLGALFTVLAFVFLWTGVVHFLNETSPEYFGIAIPALDKLVCQQSGKLYNVTEYEVNLEGYRADLRCPPGDVLIKEKGKLTFDLAFYYMVITMATVGYGDIYPDTSPMRLIIGLFVIMSIIIISKQTSELNDLIKLNSEYQVAYKENNQVKHILLSGFFNKSSLVKFLNEFYHQDHQEKSENIKIIIVQSEYPDKEIQSILLNPKFEENLHYIIGDIFTVSTLKLANVAKAEAIFLISDQHDPDSTKNDQYLILACKSLSQYSSAKIYIQFNHSQFLLHEWVDWDLAFSSQKIKMNIIVKNAFISGLSTMIMNLSSSSSSIYNCEVSETPWMLEYIHGASQEIYIVRIPQNFEECNFRDFVVQSYFDYRSLIIGVKKKIKYKEDKDIFYYIYLLNPIDYILTDEDSLIIISSTFESANLIFSNKQNKDSSFAKFIAKRENRIENYKHYSEYFRNENLDIKKQKNNYDIYSESDEENNLKRDELNVTKNVKTLNNELNRQTDYLKKRFSNEENEKTRYGGNSNYYNEGSLNGIYDTNINKFYIPEIFINRQYFKIWETNPIQFDRALEDHYIIFCKENQLWEFMLYFNQYHSQVIFFISDQHPSNKLMLTKRYFRNLVYIECSYSDQDDLIKLNLEKAKQVYILTYTVENSNVSDSGILPLIKIIEENFSSCKYTLELSDELNVRYMNNKGLESDSEEEINFKNLSQMKTNNLSKKKGNLKNIPVRLLPKFAKSDIFFCSSMESLLAFSYHNEGFLEILSKLLGIDNDSNQFCENKILENPDITMYRYVGLNKLKYEMVIYYFMNLNKPIIPMAIYRMRNDEELKNKLPYIITNPEKNFLVNRFDKIICIGEISKSEQFENFSENEFEDSQKRNKDTSDSSYFDLERKDLNSRRNALYAHLNSNKKFERKTQEPDNLNEEELLEKIRIEINNLKQFSNIQVTNNDINVDQGNIINDQNAGKEISIKNQDNKNPMNNNRYSEDHFNKINDEKNLNKENENWFMNKNTKQNFDRENNKSPNIILKGNNNMKKNFINKEINETIEEHFEENEEINLLQKNGSPNINMNNNLSYNNKKSSSKVKNMLFESRNSKKFLLDERNKDYPDTDDLNTDEIKINNKNSINKFDRINNKDFDINKIKCLSHNNTNKLDLYNQFEKTNEKTVMNNSSRMNNNQKNNFFKNTINDNNTLVKDKSNFSSFSFPSENNENKINSENAYNDKVINKVSKFIKIDKINNSTEEKINMSNQNMDLTDKIEKNNLNISANLIKNNREDLLNDEFYCLEKSDFFDNEAKLEEHTKKSLNKESDDLKNFINKKI